MAGNPHRLFTADEILAACGKIDTRRAAGFLEQLRKTPFVAGTRKGQKVIFYRVAQLPLEILRAMDDERAICLHYGTFYPTNRAMLLRESETCFGVERDQRGTIKKEPWEEMHGK